MILNYYLFFKGGRGIGSENGYHDIVQKYYREAMWAGSEVWKTSCSLSDTVRSLEKALRCQLESRCKSNLIWRDAWMMISTGYFRATLLLTLAKKSCWWVEVTVVMLFIFLKLLFTDYFLSWLMSVLFSVETHLYQMEYHDSQSHQMHRLYLHLSQIPTISH